MEEASSPGPWEFCLTQNYPNPFNAQTTIPYQLSHTGPVELAISNVAGQRVRKLVHGVQQAGQHLVNWDGRDAAGCTSAGFPRTHTFRCGGCCC